MSAKHPTFGSGHCFMAETLNKQEVEFVGELLTNHLKSMRRAIPLRVDPTDYVYEVKRINAILQKMDYPLYEDMK